MAVPRYWTRERSLHDASFRLRHTAVAVAIAAALSGLLLNADLFGRSIEERVGEFVLFHLRGPTRAPPQVLVVAMDQRSAQALGLPAGNRPWPRALHARAIRELAARGASAIAFDIVFSAPNAEGDETLAAAIRQAGNVVLLSGLERQLAGSASSVEIDRSIDPIPRFAEPAAAVAPFPLAKVPARVNRVWTFYGLTGTPTLPAVALQVAARDLAGQWVKLLATERNLLKSDVVDWTGANLLNSMRQLHVELSADPEAAERLRTRLQEQPWSKTDKLRLSRLLALYAGEDSRYLNFYGPAGTIRTINYEALLGPHPDPALHDLSGTTIFIGASELHSTTQIDTHDTVYSSSNGIDISGVEIAATAFSNLAENTSLRRPTAATLIELCLVALALGGAAGIGRTTVLLAAGGMAAIVVLLVGWYAFSSSGLVMPVATPLLFQIPVGVLAGLWCLRAEERRQRLRMARAARQFLPEAVVRNLASGPLSASSLPAGEVCYTVCLASDVEGFTTLSERLPPDAVQHLLNLYFQGMFRVLQENGGAVSNIAGDGVMCVWNNPLDAPGACAGAVNAAVGMLEYVEKFNRAHPDDRLPTRIGIHAGSAVVGIVGGAGHYTSTVVGDIANTASRIEGLNKQLGTRLLASDAVLAHVTGFTVRSLGEFRLAGKSEPILVSEVLSPLGDPRTSALAADFAEAFEAFRSRRWDDAISRLHALLRAYPEDGPARHFLTRASAERRALG